MLNKGFYGRKKEVKPQKELKDFPDYFKPSDKEQVIFKNKIVGTIHTNKGLYISNRLENHAFRKFNNGFGLSAKVIDFLNSRNVKDILIIYQENNYYFSSLIHWIFKGIPYFDGTDEQIILSLDNFNNKKEAEFQGVL